VNRFAKIVMGFGWLGTALWTSAFIQGFSVAGDRPELALHTVLSLAAAAATVLARAWCIVFLVAGRERFARREAARARKQALLAASISLVLLVAQFLAAGRLLWGSVPPAAHAALGGALVVAHVVALRCEARALALEALPTAA
jgi:hypothetical protein